MTRVFALTLIAACGDSAAMDAGADVGAVEDVGADAADVGVADVGADVGVVDVGPDDASDAEIRDAGFELAVGLNRDVVIPTSTGERQAHIYVPAAPGPRPLVVLLHGHGGSPDQLVGDEVVSPFSEWLAIAEENDLALLLPAGNPSEDTSEMGWNDCRGDGVGNPSSDDVRDLADLVSALVAIDVAARSDVFVHGHSNGAHMSIRLALERPSLVRGIAAIAGALPASSECTDTGTAMPLLLLNGDDDPILPFEGGTMPSGRGTVLSFDDTIAAFVTRNGLGAITPVESTYDRTIPGELIDTQIIAQTYAGEQPIAALRVVGGGHGEPSIAHEYRAAAEIVLGKQSHDAEMARVVWAFFAPLTSD